ncbi:MAG: discoidin domain-containing protein [Deltaproteobacteria bacterium]|nr:discoidin domain-containing protein [Deltaproteobacteria bacterium]
MGNLGRRSVGAVWLAVLVAGCGPSRSCPSAPPCPTAPPCPRPPLCLSGPTSPTTAPWEPLLGEGCRRIAPVAARGSNGADATAAIDGDARTMWNAGAHPPQAVALDLGAPFVVRGLLGVAAMTPDGEATHVVETSRDGVSFVPRLRLARALRNLEIVDLTFAPVVARYLRVVTEASPSWVAWFELVPVTCAGDAAAPGRPTPPVSPHVPPSAPPVLPGQPPPAEPLPPRP